MAREETVQISLRQRLKASFKSISPRRSISRRRKTDLAAVAEVEGPKDHDEASDGDVSSPTVAGTDSPPPEDDRPGTDLWHKAFLALSQKTRAQLQDTTAPDKTTPRSIRAHLDDLKQDVQEKQDLCEQKSWKIRVKDHELIVRDYASKIATWVQRIGDVVVPFVPPQASPPWDVVKALLQVTIDYDNQMLALLATVEKVMQVIHHGRVYELVYNPDRTHADTVKTLHEALIQLYTAALELLAYTRSQLAQGTPRRVVEALLNPDKASSLFSELDDRQAHVARAAQVCEVWRSAEADTALMDALSALKGPLARIDMRVEACFQEMKSEQSLSILEWISSIPYTKHHNTINDRRTPKTCEWLLESEVFRKWEGESSPGVLWLWGSPGVGKTFLTSKVIDHIKHTLEHSVNHEGLAFFYCNREEENRRQPLSVLQSFVRQLAAIPSKPDFIQSNLVKVYHDSRREGSDIGYAKCKKILLSLFNLYPRTTLVLDALDECEPASRDELIRFFSKISAKAQRPVKIFISSRPDEDIRNQFQAGPNVEVQAQHNQNDMEEFIKERLRKLVELNSELEPFQQEITTTLRERSDGMFQWTHLQLEQLHDCKSAESIRNRLISLPHDLKSTYDDIYGQIEQLDMYDKRLADRALIWVMAAAEPLTSEELLFAIRIDGEQDTLHISSAISEDALLSLCRHLLTIDSERLVWRVTHLSVTEYFEQYHWSRQKAHLYAGKACLLLLLDTIRWSEKHSSLVGASEIPSEAVSNDSPLDSEYSFQRYVQHNWHYHVRAQEGHDSTAVASMGPLLKRFLGSPTMSSPHYRRWLREVTTVEADEWYRVRPGRVLYHGRLYPDESPLLGMSLFGIYTTLEDWWTSTDVCLKQTNLLGEGLIELAAGGNVDSLCKMLVRAGALLDSQNTGYAITLAIGNGNLQIVRLLVSEGRFDVNMQLELSPHGSVLAAAAYHRNLEIIQYLVTAGAQVNMPLSIGEHGSALIAAAAGRDLDVVQYLISEERAEVDMRPETGVFGGVLACAAAHGDLETVKYLVREAGADVNLSLRSGRSGSALDAAAFAGELDTVMYLVEAGADVNMSFDNEGFGSALASALFLAADPVVYFLCRDAKADVNMLLPCGMGSALATAAAFGHVHAVEYLIAEGKADVNMLLKRGTYGSALCAAAYFGQEDCVGVLIAEGALVDLQVENERFSNAVEAAKAELTANDLMLLKCLDWELSKQDVTWRKEQIAQLLESMSER